MLYRRYQAILCDSEQSANIQPNMSTVKIHHWSTHSNTPISVLDQFVIPWHMQAFYFSRCCTDGTKLSCDSVQIANIQTNMSTVKVHH
jgi:hypothetical protein